MQWIETSCVQLQVVNLKISDCLVGNYVEELRGHSGVARALGLVLVYLKYFLPPPLTKMSDPLKVLGCL